MATPDTIEKAKRLFAADPTIGRTQLRRELGISDYYARGLIFSLKSKKPNALPLTDSLDLELSGYLKKHRKPQTVSQLSERFDRSHKTVKTSLDRLKAAGFNVVVRDEGCEISEHFAPGNAKTIVHELSNYRSKTHKLGFISDNHLGSKHERIDVMNALYDLYAAEGIETVYNAGNWIEGEKGKLNFHDIKVFGLDDQVDYFVNEYPQRKGITTRFVAGDDHEGWYQQRERICIGEHAENRARKAGRTDLEYIGFVEADVEFKAPGGSRWMKVMHPGGGAAYALSYSAQRLVESFQGGEKPTILAYGHYHKFDYNYYREVYAFGTGCTVDQSIFMRKQKIQAHVGGIIMEFNQAPDGAINRLKVEWIPFYDRGYYTGKLRKF
jgi:hypothetical protein